MRLPPPPPPPPHLPIAAGLPGWPQACRPSWSPSRGGSHIRSGLHSPAPAPCTHLCTCCMTPCLPTCKPPCGTVCCMHSCTVVIAHTRRRTHLRTQHAGMLGLGGGVLFYLLPGGRHLGLQERGSCHAIADRLGEWLGGGGWRHRGATLCIPVVRVRPSTVECSHTPGVRSLPGLIRK